MRIDYFHLFSKGLFTHINNNYIEILDIRLCKTHNKVTCRNLIKNAIDFRSTVMPQILGFSKRFVVLDNGIFSINTPWGYQNESFFIYSPHIFTLELLQYGNALDLHDAKLFLSILIEMRSVAFSLEPLINRIYSFRDIEILKIKVVKLRDEMSLLLPNVNFPKNHWLSTAINNLVHNGMGQCDSNEAQHL